MSLSQNIKQLRGEKGMTQEQLAEVLGVSAQAVSKWETGETYPDGSLLVPLAKILDATLDELFDNNIPSMKEISKQILHMLQSLDGKQQYVVARDICWQIERGLFPIACEGYNPDEVKNLRYSSYVLKEGGFTMVSNSDEAFFAPFPQPEKGYGGAFENTERLQKVFAALADANVFKALKVLYRHNNEYVFESAVLQRECGFSADETAEVIRGLIGLRVICCEKVIIDGAERTLYRWWPSHRLIALMLIARETLYSGAYTMQSHIRTTPFIV